MLKSSTGGSFCCNIFENEKENESMLGGKPWDEWIEEYSHAHVHPINKIMHSIGIPMIAVSLLLIPVSLFVGGIWRISLALFALG